MRNCCSCVAMALATTRWPRLSVSIRLLLEPFLREPSMRSERSTSHDMAKNKEAPIEQWVDDRMAALSPASEWRPNTKGGLSRLEELRGNGNKRPLGWGWAVALTAAACLGAMTLPATRVLAQRCVGACSEAGLRLL